LSFDFSINNKTLIKKKPLGKKCKKITNILRNTLLVYKIYFEKSLNRFNLFYIKQMAMPWKSFCSEDLL